MKKLTSILTALFFAITAVFAQNSKSVEIDLVAGTVKNGLAKSIVWTTDSIQITQESRSLNGTQGAAGAVDVTDVSKPKLTDGQDFIFKVTSTVYPQITNIAISYEGANYGGLVAGTTRSGGKVIAESKCVASLSTAENGTHNIKIIGGAQQLYVQNYSATPLHVTKIVVTCAVAGYVEEEEAQTDTATVTSMQELQTALGTRTKVTVLYKNLKPVTTVSSSGTFYDDYMPDGTTKLNMGGYTLPADFDCYGTYSAADGKFTVDSIVGLHAFANLYLLKNYYETNKSDANILNPLNITDPVVVTGVDGNNVFVQYSYARINDNLFNDHLVINGEHSLKVGDQIASFTAKYNKSTSLTLDEENTVLVRNAYFSVAATSLGEITSNNTVKYKALSSISNITSQAGVAAQLPSGGIIVKEGTKYFYTIGTDSLEIRPATGVDIESFVGKKMELAIKGIVDYCNTADYAKAFIANVIKEINTNYETISQWLRAASEGEGEGSLKLPVVVTHSEYRNSKQYIFIGDATGGLCLIGETGVKVDSIKTGHVLTGIAGKLDLSDTKKTPQLSIPNNIQVVDSNKTVEPVEVTIAELLAEENNALNNGKPAIKYANRLVKIRQAVKSASFIKGNPRFYGLIQNNGEGKDTLTYSYNTLNAYHSTFSTTDPMRVTGIVDFRCINANNLYSIYPRSAEDVKYDFAEPVITPTPGTYYTKELELTITCNDPAMKAIYYSFDIEEADPTLDGELYEGPIKITNDTTIWYAVEYNNKIMSDLFQASYNLEEPGIHATWSIEDKATIEYFTDVTITFEGVDSVGRKLDGVEVKNAVPQLTTSNVLFYSVAADGTRTPVAGGNGLMQSKGNGLSITYSVTEDKGYTLVNNKFMPKGNYCIVIDAGDVLFTPNRTSPLPKVYNDKEFVLNFTIENDYEEKVDPVQIDAAFTANPADNSTLKSISEVVITFTDKTSVTIGELGETPRADVWPFLNQVMTGNEDDEFGGSLGGMSQAVAPMLCEVVENTPNAIRIYVAADFIGGATSIANEGTYTLTIPAGVVLFSETEINKPITLNYTIKGDGVNVDIVTTENIYTYNGTIMADSDIQIFTITGQNVTNMNGNLQNGVYVVKTATATTKVVIK